jgi:hypothetical protein
VTTKERLHQLVDGLSETEADEALQYIASRHEDKDGFTRWLATRPEDDEPLTPQDKEAIAQGRADLAAGRLTPLGEIKRELAEKTPEQNRRAAALLREVRPKLTSQRQREIAEEMAKRFVERAAVASDSR